MNREVIRKVALSFVDQEERDGNSGFKDPIFEELIKLTGWLRGQAWCCYFAKLVWMQSGMDTDDFSGSTVATFNNYFGEYGSDRISKVAEIGDVAIWQTYRNGKARWTGHAGLVVALSGEQMITVEGNANDAGGREGIEVALKIRRRNNFYTNNGLRLLGFIKPTKITKITHND